MNYLRCTRCRQRFYAEAGRFRILARCEFCGGDLRPIERPEDRPYRLGPGDDRRPLPFASPAIVRADPGTYPDHGASYPSLLEFARTDLARLHSRERDFGLRWRDGTAAYRAAWIEDTGELYVVQLGPAHAGGGHVQLLAVHADLGRVETALAGWQDVIDDSDSLGWLRDRVRLHLPPPTVEGGGARAQALSA